MTLSAGHPVQGFAAGFSDLPTCEIERQEEVYAGLADAVRGLVDATIRTTVPHERIRAVEASVRALTDELRESRLSGPFGIRYNAEGRSWNWGNAAVGIANAIAPPMELLDRPGGGLRAELTLGAAYEGPPGMVHGGVTMLLLDHLMGETGSDGHRRITMTGTLTGRYLRPTPLGPVVVEGWIAREEGRKVYVEATLGTPDEVTVEAHGIFVVPSWAQDA